MTLKMYIVVRESSFDSLESEVNKRMKEGYLPHGSLQVGRDDKLKVETVKIVALTG